MSKDITIPEAARPTSVTQVTAVEQARAIAEVQAAVVVAQQCPRDMSRAEGEMRDACGRIALAERAFYRVPIDHVYVRTDRSPVEPLLALFTARMQRT